jgi:hypothetical protein
METRSTIDQAINYVSQLEKCEMLSILNACHVKCGAYLTVA